MAHSDSAHLAHGSCANIGLHHRVPGGTTGSMLPKPDCFSSRADAMAHQPRLSYGPDMTSAGHGSTVRATLRVSFDSIVGGGEGRVGSVSSSIWVVTSTGEMPVGVETQGVCQPTITDRPRPSGAMISAPRRDSVLRRCGNANASLLARSSAHLRTQSAQSPWSKDCAD